MLTEIIVGIASLFVTIIAIAIYKEVQDMKRQREVANRPYKGCKVDSV